jgi:DNA-binding FadR family transcriptional regulator
VNELTLYRRSALAQSGSLPTSTAEHHKIVDAIATGNPLDAGHIMREHAMAGRTRMHAAHAAAASPLRFPLKPKG